MNVLETISIALLLVSGTDSRATIPVPEPVAHTERLQSERGLLTGVASYYDWKPGQAAAGPDLRSLLGSDWRGQSVSVCNRAGNCAPVVLTDWCQCYKDEKKERVIDLDDATFASLSPLSAGILHVSVQAE